MFVEVTEPYSAEQDTMRTGVVVGLLVTMACVVIICESAAFYKLQREDRAAAAAGYAGGKKMNRYIPPMSAMNKRFIYIHPPSKLQKHKRTVSRRTIQC